MTNKLIWTEHKDSYVTENHEIAMYQDDNGMWMLVYTDFWTVEGTSFVVKIINHYDKVFAVPYLKQYAETVYKKYLEYLEKKQPIEF